MTDQIHENEGTIIAPKLPRRPGQYTEEEYRRALLLHRAMFRFALPSFFVSGIFMVIFLISEFLRTAGVFGMIAFLSVVVFVFCYMEIARVATEKHAEEEQALHEESRKVQEEQTKAQIQRTIERVWQKKKAEGWTMENYETFIKKIVKQPEWVEHVNTMTKLNLTPNPPLANIENAEAWARKAARLRKTRSRFITCAICAAVIIDGISWYFFGLIIGAVSAALSGVILAVCIFNAYKSQIDQALDEERAWRKKYDLIPYKYSVLLLADYVYELPREFESQNSRNRINMMLEYMTHLQYDEFPKHFHRPPTRKDLEDAVKVYVYPIILELEIPVFRCGVIPYQQSKPPEEPSGGIAVADLLD